MESIILAASRVVSGIWSSIKKAANWLLTTLLAMSLWEPQKGQMPIKNDRPIIGVLEQELSVTLKRYYPGYDSYISASYVKAVEAAGARVVPIHINQSPEYYNEIVRSVNGLIFPGGNIYFNFRKGYAQAGEILYQQAKELNREGIYFPILGICLGFELMLFLDNQKTELRTICTCEKISLPLKFKSDFKKSNLFQNAPDSVIKSLSNKNITYNSHRFCVTEKKLKDKNLDQIWRVLSTNEDSSDEPVEFISTLESLDYPFIATQFHPEKNAYDWRQDLRIDHSQESIEATRYFFEWLVVQASKNLNKFDSDEKETNALIYNYNKDKIFPKYKLIYEEIYLFKNDILEVDEVLTDQLLE